MTKLFISCVIEGSAELLCVRLKDMGTSQIRIVANNSTASSKITNRGRQTSGW